MDNAFRVRHYVPETDLSPLAHMLTEIESIDRDGEDTSEEYLRASLAWPNYRPAQDVWVAEVRRKAGWIWGGTRAALATLHDLRGCPSINSDGRGWGVNYLN